MEQASGSGYRELELLSQDRVTRFSQPGKVLEDHLDYRAVIDTTKGRIVLDLFKDSAPNTVNSFVFLALHRYYDGIVFHRVLDGFMAQTGDPTGTGSGGPGYTFADEFDSRRSHRGAGVLSMANAGPGTNGSQFFITFVPTPWLDGKHSVFGEVVEGIEVLDKLQRVDPMRPSGAGADMMRSVRIQVKG